MRAVVQRVSRAAVRVDAQPVGEIGPGLLVLLGVARGDGEADLAWLAEKVAHLRIFPDDAGAMNRSVQDAAGAVLLVSQFTLLGDCRRGRRPSFTEAEAPEAAARWCERFAEALRERGLEVATGRFGSQMAVELVNDGPVTLLLDSRKAF